MFGKALSQSIIATCAIALMTTGNAWALPISHFATTSRLARGHWVKISVTQSGMYELTRDQLAQMGFNDPSRVRIYGHGGIMMKTVLSEDLPDDLTQVPTLRRNDKVCFYAVGPVQMTLSNLQKRPHYTRERNTYSQLAYYFVTDNDDQPATPSTRPYAPTAAGAVINTSLDCVLHERELMSPGFTGTELLGEDIVNNNRATQFPFTLTNPSEARLGLTTKLAVKAVRAIKNPATLYGVSCRFTATVTTADRSTTVPYQSSTIPGSLGTYVYYQNNPGPDENMQWCDLPQVSNEGHITYTVNTNLNADSALIELAKLDYFIITYNHFNRIDGIPGAQCVMGVTQSSGGDIYQVEGADDIMVWDVTTPAAPMQMLTHDAGSGNVRFTPGEVATPRVYMAFSPSHTLHQIAGYEVIENQNLHAMDVPDMLIVTHKEFVAQGQRIARLHQMQDGLKVAVVDQAQVFNEFSAGMPDAMGIRLLCKMLYDRNSSRFKNLLLLGNISFDNRGIVTGKTNRVICYESAVSNNEDNSYLNDDFYGYLLDNSGQRPASDRLCIGIGHMPVANAHEAATAVDKLYDYVFTQDYGAWRNRYALLSENSAFKQEDSLINSRTIYVNDSTRYTVNDTIYQLHESQCAGIGDVMDTDNATQMMRDMSFLQMYPQNVTETYKVDKTRTPAEAKRHLQEMLNDGQYFMTYVGHANANAYANSGLWTKSDVEHNSYSRLPIMTTACCDVARFDSDERGVAEMMFHKRDGGAIALYTTTRQVYASQNDLVNREFVNQMFSYHKSGKLSRLGDAYMASKNSPSGANTNKFNFVLLGDPALLIEYPKPLFQFTSINGLKVSGSETVSVAPLQQLTIQAQVVDEANRKQVNTDFDGEATITVYDALRVALPAIKGTGVRSGKRLPLYYPRERLAQVTGRIRGGKFVETVTLPRFTHAAGSDSTLLISIYAHRDGTSQMVNGVFDGLRLMPYDTNTGITDTTGPVIHKMFLNNEQDFVGNATVGPNCTLYIQATDDMAFNTQQTAAVQGITVTLDGGSTSYALAKNMATITDGGRALALAMPLSNLTAGRHTLECQVSDLCGNIARETISFVVSSEGGITLQTTEVAATDKAQINLTSHDTINPPAVNIRITDIDGNMVWRSNATTMPCTWPLTDLQGRRVKAGLYRIYGNYTGAEGYGGSNVVDFVVLDPIK